MTRDLSVVIPAWNEAKGIARTIEHVSEEIARLRVETEILIVNDGSNDSTASVARTAVAGKGSVIELPGNQGKGSAVRAGMLAAKGERRIFTDADLSVDPRFIADIYQHLLTGADVAITSRRLAGSKLLRRQPKYREVMGAIYRTVASSMLVPGVSDLTCGLKGFSARATVEIFSVSRIPRFGFDLEVLYLARRRGLHVVEVPVAWADDPDTRVALPLDTLRSAIELIAVPLNAAIGRYGPWKREPHGH